MSSVDVIVPVYNGEKFIGEAVNSILQQTFTNLKVIVVDDGSTDNSAKIIETIRQNDARVTLLSPGRKGMIGAINCGLHHSTAPFFAFLDADDLWENTKLEKQMKLLNDRQDVVACFAQMKEFESFEEPNALHRFRARKEVMNGVSKISFLGKRELLRHYGYFDEKTNTGDFILWFSPIINAGEKYVVLPEVLAYRRIHDNNFTQKINPKDYLKILKAHLDAKKKDGQQKK